MLEISVLLVSAGDAVLSTADSRGFKDAHSSLLA